jgi:hypothetical protein
MKRFADLREKAENRDPPALLMLRRKYIRMFPGNVKVAVYQAQGLKQFITIPFSNIHLGEAVEAPTPFKDDNLEILKNIVVTGKDDTIKFSDKSEYDVDVMTANAILSIYARCSKENKEKMEMCLTKGVGGFMKLAKFAMQNQ